MTRRQSNNQWSGGIAAHPAPKIPSAKIRWKISRLDFLGSRRHPPHWLSSKGPNYQHGILLISAGAIEGHLEVKTPRNCHQVGLVLVRQCPGSLATQKKLAYLSFHFLDHPPYSPDLDPSDYHLFPGLKKQLKGRHFSSDAEVIAAAQTWLDGQLSEFFFEWLAEVRARGWEVYWASCEVCWINPEFGSCSCFLPGRAKDLSAPPL